MFFNNKKNLLIPTFFYFLFSFFLYQVFNWFFKKTEFFHSFFAKQYTVINNGSNLPPQLLFKIDNFLSYITFSSNDILKLIQILDSEKAHGQDRIIIEMLKICGPSICKPFEVFLKLGNYVRKVGFFNWNRKKQTFQFKTKW